MIQKSAQGLTDLIYSIIPRPHPRRKALERAKIVAHRGLCRGPESREEPMENSMPAFTAAIAAGAWGIEFDIRFCRDHVPFIHHDPTPLSRLTAEELKQERPDICLLSEVVDRLRGQTHFMIELKEPLTEWNQLTFHKALNGLKPIEEFHLLSLDMEILKKIRTYPKECLLAVCELNVQEALNATLSEGWAGLAGHYVLLNHRVQHRLKEKGLQMGTGYICSKNALYRELNRGVDWIFTNHTTDLSHWLQSAKNNT